MNTSETPQVNQFELFLSVATQRTSIIGALKVTLIVGTLVNLINQGSQIVGLQFAQVSWSKILVTFCIPFFVSIYNATATRLRFDPGVRAVVSTRLTCRKCLHTFDVKKEQIVPECSKCGKETRWTQSIN